MKINAFAALQPNEELVPFSYEKGLEKPNEILIEISHCGLCHSDLHLIEGDWGSNLFPLVPGHEIVGHVLEKGENVASLEIGQRVGVGWQSACCGKCPACEEGFEQVCEDGKEKTCMGRFGGFGDKIIVDHQFAFPIPDTISSEAAAPLLCAGTTVFSPLMRHGLGKGHRIGVVGLGGLGHLAVQFLRSLGSHVTVLDPVAEKEKDAFQLGANTFVPTDQLSKYILSKPRLHGLLICTNANLDWESYLKLLHINGKLVLVGIPNKPLSIPQEFLIDRLIQVTGSAIGSRKDISAMLSHASKHGIAPLVEVYPKKEINHALKRLQKNAVRYRAVIDFQT